MTAVTVKDNGDGTVTMANGIVSILIDTAANRLNSIAYTTNNSGTPRTVETIKDQRPFPLGRLSTRRPDVYLLARRSIPPPTAAAMAT